MLFETWSTCMISFCLASVCLATGDEWSTSTTLLPSNNGSLSSNDQTNSPTEGVKDVLDVQVHASNDAKSNEDNLSFNGNQDWDNFLEALNLDLELNTTKDKDIDTADKEGNQSVKIEDFISTLKNDTNGQSTEFARAIIPATKNDRIDSTNSSNEPLNVTGMDNNSKNSEHLGTTMLHKGNDRTFDINIEPLNVTGMKNISNNSKHLGSTMLHKGNDRTFDINIEPLNVTGMKNISNNSKHLGTTMLHKGNNRTFDINIEPLNDTGMENNSKNSEHLGTTMLHKGNDRTFDINIEPLNVTGMKNISNNSKHLGSTMLHKGNDRTFDLHIEPLNDTLDNEMNNVRNSTHVDKSADEQLCPGDTDRNKNEIDSITDLWSFLSPSKSLENLAKDFSEPKSDGLYKNIDEPVNTKEECIHVTLTTMANVEKELHETMPISVIDVVSSMTSTSGCPNSRENFGSNYGTAKFKENDSNARDHGNFVTVRDFPPQNNMFGTRIWNTTTMEKSIMRDFTDTEHKTSVILNQDMGGNILNHQNDNSEVQKFKPHISLLSNKVKQVGKLGRINIGQDIGPSSHSRLKQKTSAKENKGQITTRTGQMVNHSTSHIGAIGTIKTPRVPMRDGVHVNIQMKNEFSPVKEQTNYPIEIEKYSQDVRLMHTLATFPQAEMTHDIDVNKENKNGFDTIKEHTNNPTSTRNYTQHMTTGKPKGFRFVDTDNRSIFHYSESTQKVLQSLHIITRKPIIILDNIASVPHNTMKNDQRGLPLSINLLSSQTRARTVEHVENNLIYKRPANIKGINGRPTILETPWENGFTTKHTSTTQPVCTSTHNQKIKNLSFSKNKVMDTKNVPSLKLEQEPHESETRKLSPGKFLPDILDWDYNDAYKDHNKGLKLKISNALKGKIDILEEHSTNKRLDKINIEDTIGYNKSRIETIKRNKGVQKLFNAEVKSELQPSIHKKTEILFTTINETRKVIQNLQDITDGQGNTTTPQISIKNSFDSSEEVNIQPVSEDNVLNIPTEQDKLVSQTLNIETITNHTQSLGIHNTVYNSSHVMSRMEELYKHIAEDEIINDQESTNTNEQENKVKEQESTSIEEQGVDENKNMNMDAQNVEAMKNEDQSEINNYAEKIINCRQNHNQDENGNSGDWVKVEMETDNNGEDVSATQDIIEEAEDDNVVSDGNAFHNEFSRDVSVDFAGYPDEFPDLMSPRKQLEARITIKEPAKERNTFQDIKVSHVQDVLENILSGSVRKSIQKPILSVARKGKLVFNNKLMKTHAYPTDVKNMTDKDEEQADTENKDTTPSLWYKARKKSEEDTTTHTNVQEDSNVLKGVWNTAVDKVEKLQLLDQFYTIMQSVLRTPQRVMTLSERLVKILTPE